MNRAFAYDELYPLVPAIYFAGALGLAMGAFHPVYIGLSLVGGVALLCYLQGVSSTAKMLLWQLVLALVVALFNMCFGSQGTTPLFTLLGKTFMAEKVCYALCMGGLLASSLMWCACAAQVMSSDKTMALLGRTPVLGTTLTLTTRLVPLYLRRAQLIGEVERANTANKQPLEGTNTSGWLASLRHRLESFSRRLSVLVGWGLEDSLEMGDSMRARGWGSCHKRSRYKRHKFTIFDAGALVVVLTLCGGTILGAIALCGPFEFYPTMGPWPQGVWWPYVLAGLYYLLPLVLEGGAKLLWRR